MECQKCREKPTLSLLKDSAFYDSIVKVSSQIKLIFLYFYNLEITTLSTFVPCNRNNLTILFNSIRNNLIIKFYDKNKLLKISGDYNFVEVDETFYGKSNNFIFIRRN